MFIEKDNIIDALGDNIPAIHFSLLYFHEAEPFEREKK